MLIPVIFFILIEIYFGWPYNRIHPAHQRSYISLTGTLISVFLFAAVTGLAVNYWHFKKLNVFFSQRRFQLITSVIALCLFYIPAKLLVFGSTMSLSLFNSTAGSLPDFKLLEKILSGGMLVYFLFQAGFYAWSLKRLRALKINMSVNG